MRVKLQLVISHDDGHEETVTDIITLNKNNQRIEHLGLSLAESKQLLSTLQRHLLQQQLNTFLDTHATCPDCGTPRKLKAHGSRSFRTLFGTLKFGFDHGAGHPFLFLDDAKALNCRKNNGFKDLGNYSEWPKVAGAVIKA